MTLICLHSGKPLSKSGGKPASSIWDDGMRLLSKLPIIVARGVKLGKMGRLFGKLPLASRQNLQDCSLPELMNKQCWHLHFSFDLLSVSSTGGTFNVFCKPVLELSCMFGFDASSSSSWVIGTGHSGVRNVKLPASYMPVFRDGRPSSLPEEHSSSSSSGNSSKLSMSWSRDSESK